MRIQVVGLGALLSASNFVKCQRSELDQRMDRRQICNKLTIVHFGTWAGRCSLDKSLNFAACLKSFVIRLVEIDTYTQNKSFTHMPLNKSC